VNQVVIGAGAAHKIDLPGVPLWTRFATTAHRLVVSTHASELLLLEAPSPAGGGPSALPPLEVWGTVARMQRPNSRILDAVFAGGDAVLLLLCAPLPSGPAPRRGRWLEVVRWPQRVATAAEPTAVAVGALVPLSEPEATPDPLAVSTVRPPAGRDACQLVVLAAAAAVPPASVVVAAVGDDGGRTVVSTVLRLDAGCDQPLQGAVRTYAVSAAQGRVTQLAVGEGPPAALFGVGDGALTLWYMSDHVNGARREESC